MPQTLPQSRSYWLVAALGLCLAAGLPRVVPLLLGFVR